MVPDEIEMGEYIFDIDFHPHQNIVAGSMVNGVVELYQYSETTNTKVLELTFHTDSCRSVLFSNDGQTLYTGSSDRSIRAFDTNGAVVWTELNAHRHSVNILKVLKPNVIISGDDSGSVKIWDTRQHSCIVEWTDHEDYISDMAVNDSKDHLIVTSGDGTLSAYDLRTNTLQGRSDDLEDELLSIVIGKNGKKVFCGSQDGVIAVFSWGQWEDMKDRFPGHPNSIECMLKIDEDTVLTGSSDGIIRVVQMQPDKLLGVIGDHENFPIETMKYSHDRSLIGSTSHTNKVHFWDISFLNEEEDEEDSDDNMDSSDDEKPTRKIRAPKQEFFDDL